MKSTRFVLTPFYEILDTMVPLRRLRIDECTQANNSDRFAGRQIIEFSVQYHHSLLLSESKKQKVASFNIRSIIRFGKIEELEVDEHGIVTRDSFPLHLHVDLNNTTISLPGLLPNDRYGKDGRRYPRPVDLSEGLIDNPIVSNHMAISWMQDECKNEYFYALYLVRLRSCDELTSILLSQHVSAMSTTLSLVYEQCSNLNGTVDEDVVLVNNSVNTSLNCPVSRGRIEIPIRGQHCTHLQCFDCMTYLVMNFKKPTWRCPVCDKITLFCFLEIDGLIFGILKDDRSKAVHSVQFNKAGQWRPERKIPGSPDADQPYLEVLQCGNQGRSTRGAEVNSISSLKVKLEEHKIEKYLQLVLSNSNHKMSGQFESQSPMVASPLTLSDPCSPQMNVNLLIGGLVGLSPPADLQDAHLAAMLRHIPNHKSLGAQHEPPPPQYHYEYLPQSSSVLMQRSCPPAPLGDSCVGLQITKVTSMAARPKDLKDIVVISDDETEDVISVETSSGDLKPAQRRPRTPSREPSEVGFIKQTRAASAARSQTPLSVSSSETKATLAVLAGLCTCTSQRTCQWHNDLALSAHEGMMRAHDHIPLASQYRLRAPSAHSALSGISAQYQQHCSPLGDISGNNQSLYSIPSTVLAQNFVPDIFRTGSSLQSAVPHCALYGTSAQSMNQRQIASEMYRRRDVNVSSPQVSSHCSPQKIPRNDISKNDTTLTSDRGGVFAQFPFSSGTIVPSHDLSSFSVQSTTCTLTPSNIPTMPKVRNRSLPNFPLQSTVASHSLPSISQQFTVSNQNVSHQSIPSNHNLSQKFTLSNQNVSHQSIPSNHNLSQQFTLSNHNVSHQSIPSNHNLSQQFTLSNHNVSNQSIPSNHNLSQQFTLSNHNVSHQSIPSNHNLSQQFTLSNHNNSNISMQSITQRESLGNTSRHNEVQRAVDSVVSPQMPLADTAVSGMSLQSRIWSGPGGDSFSPHAALHANGSRVYPMSMAPNGHPCGVFAHTTAPFIGQTAASNGARGGAYGQPTIDHVGPNDNRNSDPLTQMRLRHRTNSEILTQSASRVHSRTSSNPTGLYANVGALSTPLNVVLMEKIAAQKVALQNGATFLPSPAQSLVEGPSRAASSKRARKSVEAQPAEPSGGLNSAFYRGMTNAHLDAMLAQTAAYNAGRGSLTPQAAMPGYSRGAPPEKYAVPYGAPGQPLMQSGTPHGYLTVRHNDQDNIKPDLVQGHAYTTDFTRPTYQHDAFQNIPPKQINCGAQIAGVVTDGRAQGPVYRHLSAGLHGAVTTMAPMSQNDMHAQWLHMMSSRTAPHAGPAHLHHSVSAAPRLPPMNHTLSSQDHANSGVFHGS